MDGISEGEDIARAARVLTEDWEKWKGSPLFRLKGADDLNALGNLYSLRAMCRTLLLAARDTAFPDSNASEELLATAERLNAACEELYRPVEQILRLQSYSGNVVMRLKIMNGLFGYLDIFYANHSNRQLLTESQQDGG